MRHGWVVWLLALLLCAGCGGGRRGGGRFAIDGGGRSDAAVDAGSRDGGTTTRDAGTRDAGTRDAGPPPGTDAGTDAGPPPVCSPPGPGGDCQLRVPVGSFGPLNAACLPRCSAATAAAYRACTDQACRNAAVEADTTPGIPYYIGSAPVTDPLDCASCVTYQEFHCFSLVCTSEVDAYVDHCIAGVSPELCDSSITSIDICLASVTAAEMATLDACFASADGPQGCFACD